MLRLPWLLRWSRFIVDRLHYTGHTFCNIGNGDLQKDLDQDRSVAAEVINYLINKGSIHISYLDGANVIPFLKVKFAYVNAVAMTRDIVRKDDMEDENMAAHMQTLFECQFQDCASQINNGTGDLSTEPLMSSVPAGVQLFNWDNKRIELLYEESSDHEDRDPVLCSKTHRCHSQSPFPQHSVMFPLHLRTYALHGLILRTL